MNGAVVGLVVVLLGLFLLGGVLALGFLAERGAPAHGAVTYRDIRATCGKCETEGESTTHKGGASVECPECGDLLYRKVNNG